jgi:PKD repeat protein
MRKIVIVLITVLVASAAKAQIDLSEPDRINCGTAVLHNQRLEEDPSIQLIMDAQNQWAKEYEQNYSSNETEAIIYTIPVVYHVIHNNGPENVSKAAIEASVANLNEDFQKLNSDLSQVVSAFTGITADIEVQFRLAHLDPNGNCTEGITRTVSTMTYAMGEGAKSLVNWNTTKYLNIWVGETMASGSGGYSYYPGTAPSQNNEGIVIRSAQLGNSITHEVGHFLNLPHTWGSSNTPGLATNCNIDDGISDTPLTLGNTTCTTTSATCDGNLDNVQNYMSYSGCTRMYTEGQKTRMHAALNSSSGSRNTLWTPANLIATGVADPYITPICVPIADFNYDKEFICEGASVTFLDDSYNATPTAWNWTFAGGTPSTSAISAPTIMYNTPGVYSVVHQPSTTAGSDSESKSNIITVSSLVADYAGNLVDGFESPSQFAADWRIENPEGQTWQTTTFASASGSSAVRIRNSVTTNDDEIDELISSSFDLTTVAGKQMTFKQAFVKKNSANSDRLLVYSSVDCGETWQLRLPLTGSALTTGANQAGFYSPSSSEFVERTVDLTALASETNVRFKFLFESGGGNDIYLDDINIGWPVGVDDFSNVASFSIYPNPTNSSAQISFNLVSDVKALSIKVRNSVGQEVTSVINGQSFSAGKYTLKIDEERKLAAGIYFVEFNADDSVKVQKLIVQ